MSEHPIIFSAPMIRAILAGSKTQTRRVIKPQEPPLARVDRGRPEYTSPYGRVGDRLWVRETWQPHPEAGVTYPEGRCPDGAICYAADLDRYDYEESRPWRSPIHMPRWASRITLEVTGVRVERVQEVSECDCKAEGVTVDYLPPDPDNFHPPGSYGFVRHPGEVRTEALIYREPQEAFASLWDSINAERACGWKVNPYVWVIEFRRVA